jgi:hypothetical protein
VHDKIQPASPFLNNLLARHSRKFFAKICYGRPLADHEAKQLYFRLFTPSKNHRVPPYGCKPRVTRRGTGGSTAQPVLQLLLATSLLNLILFRLRQTADKYVLPTVPSASGQYLHTPHRLATDQSCNRISRCFDLSPAARYSWSATPQTSDEILFRKWIHQTSGSSSWRCLSCVPAASGSL